MLNPLTARPERVRLRELLDRLARVVASEGWGAELNPVQRATLSYLARANRFSRSPSNVADYLLATRGTVSQTLKSLAGKGLVAERRSSSDRRSIVYTLTDEGTQLAADEGAVDAGIDALDERRVARLGDDVETLLRGALAARGGRTFGVCRTCRHHRVGTAAKRGARCALLEVDLLPVEALQVCHEHSYTDTA